MKDLSRLDGKAILELGYYDPLKKIIEVDKVNLYKYILNGAYPSNTVRHLIYKILKN